MSYFASERIERLYRLPRQPDYVRIHAKENTRPAPFPNRLHARLVSLASPTNFQVKDVEALVAQRLCVIGQLARLIALQKTKMVDGFVELAAQQPMHRRPHA